ncbi:MAG: CinA family protein [Alphaproteobacteria bacterium]
MTHTFDDEIITESTRLLARARANNLKIATAESCTGGLIIGALTEIAGSSDVVDRGFITYSNEAKMEMLGVAETDLIEHGAVSQVVAKAMATGALARSAASLSVAVSGVAGPGGGSAEKPVGLVQLACAIAYDGTKNISHEEARFGDIGRELVRLETVRHALTLMHNAITQLEAGAG